MNTKVDDGSDIADLMKIFKEQDTYDFERFPYVSKRKQQFLRSEEVQGSMVDVVREYAREYAKEELLENAKNLFMNGASFELVCKSLKSISEEELRKIYNECVKNVM